MSVFNSISVAVLIVLLVAGLITGLSISDIEILNPSISAAEANRVNVENAHREAMYTQEERLAETKTSAQINEIERQQVMADAQAAYEQQMLVLQVTQKQRSAEVWLTIVTWIGAALSASILIGTVLWVGSKAAATVKSAPKNTKTSQSIPERFSYDPWRSDEYREARIRLARSKEQAERQEALNREHDEQVQLIVRMQSVSNPSPTGKNKYVDLPLVG